MIYTSLTKHSCHNNTLTLTLFLPRSCRVCAPIVPTGVTLTQVVDKTTMPVVNDEGSKDACIVKPSVEGAPSSTTEKQAMPMAKIHATSASPSSTAKSLTRKAYLIDEEEVASDEASGGSSNDDDKCSSPQKPPPSLSPSADEGPATPPPTPPLSPSLGSSSSTDDSPPPSVESPPLLIDSPPPPPLAQLPPPSLASCMQDSRLAPKTFSVNPLGGMFSPPLDKPRVVRVIQDVLCSKRVTNYRDKASKVMTEVKSGRVCAETMEWVIRGLRSLRGKKDLKQRHGGLVFVGPQWGAPLYKTGNGVGRLLRGVSGPCRVCGFVCCRLYGGIMHGRVFARFVVALFIARG